MAIIHKNKKGFTLLEILIVVVIIAALAALAIPAYTSTTEKANKQEALSALSAVREAQQRYFLGAGHYGNSYNDLDFDPNTTMTGQTAKYTYATPTCASPYATYSAKATRTGGTIGGDYTIKIDQDGAITSNF